MMSRSGNLSGQTARYAGVVVFALAAVVIFLWWLLGPLGLLLDAIILGGIGGGFTLALVGGESYGLKLPGVAGADAQKLDPGFIGDVFVGFMAALLGIGVGIWAEVFKFDLFDVNTKPLAGLWFKNFAIAYICGFLGLRLIKAVSAQVLRQAEIEAKLQQVEMNEADAAYLKAIELIRDGQNEASLELFTKAQTLDGENSIRALIGIGRAYSRLGRYGDAIASLDRAIAISPKETQKHRVPVAYWNRACYKTLASKELARDIDSIVADLKEAIALQSAFAHDLLHEEDLKKLQMDPKFKALVPGGN